FKIAKPKEFPMNLDDVLHLLALAANLEAEGQYNHAKLLRAAAAALLTRAARRLELPGDKPALLREGQLAIERLSKSSLEPELVQALMLARQALEEGRLPTYHETPDPYLCRICGHLALGEPDVCPQCGAQPQTFQRFRPIYWLEAFDPYAALEHLRATPLKVADLLARAGDAAEQAAGEDGAWSLRQALSHLRDAQGVLALRVDLILGQDNPLMEAKAVFEWASQAGQGDATAVEIFESYRASRTQVLECLESLPLQDWWRRGRHEEFSELRLFQQVSYFACHELTHLPQIERLAG
ncbi:MAG: DinB family protein, partial [Anaerolineales bacterium]